MNLQFSTILKLLSNIDGLAFFVHGFYEGYSETTIVTLYAARDNATTSGYYCHGNKTHDQKIAYELRQQGLTLL